MVVMKTHSNLCIRDCDTQSMGALELPLGLGIQLPGDIKSYVSPGRYTLNKRLCGFFKERGELGVNGSVFHIEIISMLHSSGKSPLVVRLWNVAGEGYEYLFSDNVISFRCSLLDTQIVTNTIIMQIAAYLSHRYEGEYVSHEAVCAMGLHNIPFLIPNHTQNEYQQRYNSLMGFNNAEDCVDELISMFFNTQLNAPNLLQLIGIVNGNIPYQTMSQYTHRGSFNSTPIEQINPVITDIDQYSAISILSRIVFDHYVISINLNSIYDIKIIELDSMAGPYLSVDYESACGNINRICAEFLFEYFNMTYTDKGAKYTECINGENFTIDQIIISRTMDEYIHIQIFSGELICERIFDLILHSIMSPVMNG